MPITYVIDHENQIIEEKWTGPVSAKELKNYWLRYLADPEVLKIRRTIADLRDSEILFNGDQLDHLISSVVLPAIGNKDWKTAIVVEKSIQFGVSRQYQVFAERYSTDEIFFVPEDARAWLLKKNR